jgi:hypothetical protein
VITLDQAKQYIDSALGAAVPDFVVTAAIADVQATEAAMVSAGYSSSSIVRLQCMAVAILACPGDPRRISSQGAASGASRSFKYSTDDITKIRRELRSADTAGVLASLIGPETSSPRPIVFAA